MNRTVIVIIFGVFLGISFLYDSHAASDEFDADKVRQLIEEEKFEEALDITTEFLSNNPDHEIALSLIAEIYWELDEYFAAQTNADKTLNINPKNENALYIKSKSLYRLDKFEDALSYIDQAIKVNNQNPSTLSRKGLILFQLEQYEEAISFYDKALSLEPENETTWERMGEALLELQMYEEAVTYFTKVLEVDPHDRDTLYNISMAIQYVEEKPLSSFFTYENNEAGLKLKYPPHWVQITEIPEPLLKFQIIYPDNTGTFLFGYSYTYLVDYTTENLFEDFIDGFGVDFEDFNVENSELITIDGNEGLKFEFTTKQSGNILKVMQIVILKNEATYLFTYSAPIEDYPNHLSTIQKIIDSITIVQLEIPIILYEDTLQNYKIEHPANWQKLEEEKREFGESYMVAFVSPFKNLNDTFPEEVNVVVTK
ncbi:MAG: tetratricopeptide repeat protein, partial [Nitrosopumilus sp.]|nr:tetratricopeptide repeat protein [Nitrosopumilus sp.]